MELIKQEVSTERWIEIPDEVLEVYRILNAAGFDVNDTCGLHVHVGVRSVLGEDVQVIGGPSAAGPLHLILGDMAQIRMV